MLVAFFIGIWIVIGLILFFVALRGGPRGARAAVQTQSRGGRRVVVMALVAIYVLIGVAVPAAVIAADLDRPEQAPGGIELDSAEAGARSVFAQSCGNCHTLGAANTYGTIGPDFDTLKPQAQLVYCAILNGKVAGSGTMPAGLLEGEEARDVANFVATATGATENTSTSGEPAEPPPPLDQKACEQSEAGSGT